MSRTAERMALVVKALEDAGDRGLTMDGLVAQTGLTSTAISQAIYRLRNTVGASITVPTQKMGWRYVLAESVGELLPGVLNQFRHNKTRMQSGVRAGKAMQDKAKTPHEHALGVATEQFYAGQVTQAEAFRTLVKALTDLMGE